MDRFGLRPDRFEFVSPGVRCFHRLPMRSGAAVDAHAHAPARHDSD